MIAFLRELFRSRTYCRFCETALPGNHLCAECRAAFRLSPTEKIAGID